MKTDDRAAREGVARNRFIAALEVQSFGVIGIGTVLSMMIFGEFHPWCIWGGGEAFKFLHERPQFIEAGFAVIGSCANGDYVGVSGDGEIVLLSIGNTLTGLTRVQDYFVVVAPSLRDLLNRRSPLPSDWWEAKEKARRSRDRSRKNRS